MSPGSNVLLAQNPCLWFTIKINFSQFSINWSLPFASRDNFWLHDCVTIYRYNFELIKFPVGPVIYLVVLLCVSFWDRYLLFHRSEATNIWLFAQNLTAKTIGIIHCNYWLSYCNMPMVKTMHHGLSTEIAVHMFLSVNEICYTSGSFSIWFFIAFNVMALAVFGIL